MMLRLNKTHRCLFSSFISFLYGGMIELLQQHFFNRSGDVWDLVADVLGAIVGCWVYPRLKRIVRKVREKKKK